MKNYLSLKVLISLIALCPYTVYASDYVSWQKFYVSVYHGSGYPTNSEERTTLRFDYADSWLYGDNFLFLDNRDIGRKSVYLYSEWHPRLSLSKLIKHKLTTGSIKDILIAGQINTGNNFSAFLYGLGTDLSIPGFKWVKLNTYLRDNISISGKTYQITLAWDAPFTLFDKFKFEFGGFVDYAGKEGETKSNLLAVPQLMLDAGNLFNTPNILFAGFRYRYWHNAFALKGVNESIPELMVTWKLV